MEEEGMKRQTMIILGLCIVSWIGTCVSYFYLPDQIPIQYNTNFEPAGYGQKEWIFLMGAAPLLIYLIGRLAGKLDPNAERLKKNQKAYHLVLSIISVMILGMNWITIYLAFQIASGTQAGVRLLPIIIGFVFLALGNYLPVVRKNYFIGLRTPWTLAGEISWRKTHRVGGYLFILLGLLLCAGGLLDWKWFYIAAFAGLLAGVFFLMVYSYLVYQKYDLPLKKQQEEKIMSNPVSEHETIEK